ncbi:MAG: class I SAM-dependent methyltransferase [Pseudomonadota bacterium]
MNIKKEIFDKLICLGCHSNGLTLCADFSIRCAKCLRTYPIVNGVYSFVPEEAVSFSEVPKEIRGNYIRVKRAAYFDESFIQKLYTHYHRYAGKMRSLYGGDGSTLDIGFGAGEHYEFIRPDEKDGRSFIGADRDRFKLEYFCRNHQDVPVFQADALDLPFSDGSFDVVQLLATIEHFDIKGVNRVISESLRVLKANGILIVCYPAEGSLLLKCCRKIMGVILKFKSDYDMVKDLAHTHAHLSSAAETRKALKSNGQLKNVDSSFYFLSIPNLHLSLFINEVYRKI